jgi:hypothetical protein
LLNNAKIPVLLFLFFGFTYCVPKHITRVKVTEPIANDLIGLKRLLKIHSPVYKWLDTQGEITYSDGTNTVTANLNMKTRKDSLIWVSGNVLIEAVRMLITRDSAVILNRLQKNYSVFPVSDLNKMLAINDLDLHSVQNLMQALPPFKLDDKSRFENKIEAYHIINQQPTYKEDITIDTRILRMTQYRYEHNATEYVLVNYSDFKQVGDQMLPNKIDMDVRTPDKIHIILNVSDYSLQQTDEASFYIPESYTKVK